MDKYETEEVAGTLFLRHGNLVLAANIGEEGNITDVVRKHFEFLCDAGNREPPRLPPPPDIPPGLTAVDIPTEP